MGVLADSAGRIGSEEEHGSAECGRRFFRQRQRDERGGRADGHGGRAAVDRPHFATRPAGPARAMAPAALHQPHLHPGPALNQDLPFFFTQLFR